MAGTDLGEALATCLKELHLPAFRSGYEELARQARQEGRGYEQYLLSLAERECQERVSIGQEVGQNIGLRVVWPI